MMITAILPQLVEEFFIGTICPQVATCVLTYVLTYHHLSSDLYSNLTSCSVTLHKFGISEFSLLPDNRVMIFYYPNLSFSYFSIPYISYRVKIGYSTCRLFRHMPFKKGTYSTNLHFLWCIFNSSATC